jgi:DNA-binding protein H-NS
MSSLNDLLAQKAALEQKIAEVQREERGQAIAKIRALMAEYGLALTDISARAPTAPRKASSKVAPKYRNPATGDTWSGRGLKPNWLRAALESGRTLEEFAI